MKFYMTGQEKDDLLRQVTAWAGLTCVFKWIKNKVNQIQQKLSESETEIY